jgi:hypothetical protein
VKTDFRFDPFKKRPQFLDKPAKYLAGKLAGLNSLTNKLGSLAKRVLKALPFLGKSLKVLTVLLKVFGLGEGELCVGGGFIINVSACLGLFDINVDTDSVVTSHGISDSVAEELEPNVKQDDTETEWEYRWSAQTDRTEGIPQDHMYLLAFFEAVVQSTPRIAQDPVNTCAGKLDTGVVYKIRPLLSTSTLFPDSELNMNKRSGYMW